MTDIEQAAYDLPRIFALRETVETLDLNAPPMIRVLPPTPLSRLNRVGILCGSFNPLTLAHSELALHACQTFALDYVFFTLAKVTVDKEQVSGMSLEDRLLLLSLYAERHEKVGVVLVNRGLYFEQAAAFQALFGSHVQLSFLIGMDKLLQIFDPRYYQDRDAALRQLFSLASLMVANRGDMERESFDQLLDRPENRSYKSSVRFFALPQDLADLSATAVRDALAHGQSANELLPEEVAHFLRITRAYHPPVPQGDKTVDVYTLRVSLLDALYSVRSGVEGAKR
jgi:nicotinic acid mononucleotide adenylyltransferase